MLEKETTQIIMTELLTKQNSTVLMRQQSCKSEMSNSMNNRSSGEATLPPVTHSDHLECTLIPSERRGEMRSVDDRIQSMNNVGVEFMNSMALDEAVRCFQMSLDLAVATHDSVFPSINTISRIRIGMATDRSCPMHESATTNVDKHRNTQKRETVYDEGMNKFTQSIIIDDPENETPLPTLLAIILYNVGHLHIRLNDDDQAYEFFSKSLDFLLQPQCRVEEQNSCNSKLGLLVCVLHNIAYIDYQYGRFDIAAQALEKALHFLLASIQCHRYPSNALDIARTMNCLGVLYFHITSHSSSTKSYDRENFRSAAAYLCQETLAIWRSAHGDHHVEIATVLNNLGRIYVSMRKYAESTMSYTEALDIRCRLLGKDHIDVAATLYNMGRTCHEQGQLSEAMELYKRALDIVQLRLGHRHRDVGILLKSIAQIYHDQKEEDLAKSTYEKSLHIARSALGTAHVEVAVILNKYGNLLYETGDFIRAICIYKEGLQIEREVLEFSDSNIAVTLVNIARIYKQIGRYEDALELYEEAAGIQRLTRGGENEVAATISQMGLINYQMSNCSEALRLYQEVLWIRWSIHGEGSNLEVASTLNSIGLVLFKLRENHLALRSFQRCLEMRREILGSDHRDVSVVLFNIATTYLESGNEEEALKVYKETIRVERLAHGERSNEVAFTMRQVGLLHQDRGDFAKAIHFFRQTLAIQRSTVSCSGGGGRASIVRTLTCLGNVHLQQGDANNAVVAYSEALRLLESDGSSSVVDLAISGLNMYALSKFHPECAAAA